MSPSVPMTPDQRVAVMKTALGTVPADVVFSGGQLVNVYSGEILPHLWVALKGDRIAYVGPPREASAGPETRVIELGGRFILPGFIDAHTHLDSIFQVRAYAEHALAFGNTTAVSEVAMIANAMGAQGVDCFLAEAAGLPLRVFVLAPPLVPPFPHLETSRPFPRDHFERLLSMEGCLGVGETYWARLIDLEERALRQYRLADRMGKRKEGHAAGAGGRKLIAYAAAGTSSCHESVSADEALEKLRLGMAVMIREGYVRRELSAVSGIAEKGVDLSHVMMVTDIADPEELVSKGGMNLLLRQAVELGFHPVQAVQMVTINAARYFGLTDLGAVAPGKVADLVVVDDLKEFRCSEVWASGRLVARDGRLSRRLEPFTYPDEALRSIALGRIGADVFRIPFGRDRATVRVVEIVNETITREAREEMAPKAGHLVADPGRDILKIAVFQKSRRDSIPALGFAKGIGLHSGAIATSLIWDTNNVLAVGLRDEDMAFAVNRLTLMGGGMVVVQGEQSIAELPLPVCGVISVKPLPEIVREIKEIEGACHRLGSGIRRPFLTLQTFCFTGLPFLRLTDRGLVDVRKMCLVPLVV